MRSFLYAFALAGVLSSTASQAAIIVDGVLDAEYGQATSAVTYDSQAPESNFGNPTSASDAIGYNIYLKAENGSVYGFLQGTGGNKPVGPFSNLYFDLDPANGNGSDLGFEITNQRAFVPGVNGYASTPNLTFVSATPDSLEFAIPETYFTGPISGLSYYPGQSFPSGGDRITLRLSQSFGYSVAGDDSFGPDRLGSVQLSAVPLPASFPLFGAALLGLGVLGVGARRRTASRLNA